MEKMLDLKDLLKHEIIDLYSVETQIIEALPDMIEKAINPSLKKALSEHLRITEEQKARLDKIKSMLIDNSNEEEKEKPGFFGRIFGGSNEEKCKGMEGILEEGKKMVSADMNQEVLDAAIIAACQKVEHYEICGYGTALAYARELRLSDIAELLGASLDEEYEADDNLTFLAVGQLNLEAEFAGGDLSDDQPIKQISNSKSNNRSGGGPRGKKAAAEKKRMNKAEAPAKKGISNRTASKTASKNAAGSSRGGSAKSAPGKGNNGKKGNVSKSTANNRSSAPAKKSQGQSGKSPVKGRAGMDKNKGRSANNAGSRGGRNKTAAPKKSQSRAPQKSAPKKAAPKKSAPQKSAPKKAAPKKAASKGKRR